jgi:RimJ/RimL family protein N-acetyltransferase
MTVIVRPMELSEVAVVIDYFHEASPKHLETLGVDPTRLPSRHQWRKLYEAEFAAPLEQRKSFLLLWERDGKAVGFSTADKIRFGEEAYMHLHVLEPVDRATGLGSSAVRKSVDIYFDVLKLKRLYCEPNAFNIAPNRTLQKAGFKYLKTHMTVPGPLNYHQAVTRWLVDRGQPADGA